MGGMKLLPEIIADTTINLYILRNLMAKAPFDTMQPLDKDKIFQDHMRRMAAFENIAKKVRC